MHHPALLCTILHHCAPFCTTVHHLAPPSNHPASHCTIQHNPAPPCTTCTNMHHPSPLCIILHLPSTQHKHHHNSTAPQPCLHNSSFSGPTSPPSQSHHLNHQSTYDLTLPMSHIQMSHSIFITTQIYHQCNSTSNPYPEEQRTNQNIERARSQWFVRRRHHGFVGVCRGGKCERPALIQTRCRGLHNS